jgi:hypothetical protein
MVIQERKIKVIAYRDVFPKILKLIKLEDIVNEGFGVLIEEISQVKILVLSE